MAGLDLAFLGDYRATLDGEPISGFESARVRALLAYLAVEAEHPHRREALAALLWPERPEAGARASLSQALFNLRSILGDRRRTPPLLVVTAQTIGMNNAAGATVDVTSFTSLLQVCAQHPHPQIEMCEACRQRLQEAVALYGGSFLQDLSVDDSVSFDEWVLLRREHLHRLVMEVLGWLTAGYERRGEYAQGLQYAWRQVALDPWREEAQRQLMRLLALNGQRTAALAQYRVCCELLDKELAVEPAAETVALYEQIRQGLVVALPRPLSRRCPLLSRWSRGRSPAYPSRLAPSLWPASASWLIWRAGSRRHCAAREGLALWWGSPAAARRCSCASSPTGPWRPTPT